MPDWKAELRERIADLNLDPTHEADLLEELSQHLQDRYEELLSSGVSAVEAHAKVLDDLSRRDLLSRELRRVVQQVHGQPVAPGAAAPGNMLAAMWRDIPYGMRTLRFSPAFSLLSTLSLALCIGANTANFQFVDPLSRPA